MLGEVAFKQCSLSIHSPDHYLGLNDGIDSDKTSPLAYPGA